MVPCGVALVFRVLPAPRLGPEGPEGERGSFPANATVWQPHLEPARAPFSQITIMTAGKSLASPGALQGPLAAVREVQAVLPAKAGVW